MTIRNFKGSSAILLVLANALTSCAPPSAQERFVQAGMNGLTVLMVLIAALGALLAHGGANMLGPQSSGRLSRSCSYLIRWFDQKEDINMIEGLILGMLIAVVAVGGEAVFAALGSLPVIGGVASWYSGLIGPLQPGLSANLIYGVMAAQVVILPLSILLCGPAALRRVIAMVRKTPAV